MFSYAESIAATQALLRSGISLADFRIKHGIRGKESDGLVILDYDQIECNWTEPYGWACRGLIRPFLPENIVGDHG